MGLMQEFKQFAMRGNVVDMAVGVIIGGAFGKIVSSLVSDVVMPGIGLLIGGINFTEWKLILKEAGTTEAGVVIPAVTLNIGNFLLATLDFLIIAFVIFMALKAINRLKNKKDEAAATPPAPSKEEVLLTEIRDLLKK